MATLVTDQVVHADPSLANIFQLSRNTAWMNGIQFYLDDDAPIGRGHEIYLDAPWALTSVSQAQFWSDVDLSRFGGGNIRGVISVDISDWDTPGLNGKPCPGVHPSRDQGRGVGPAEAQPERAGRRRARGRGSGPLVPGSRHRSAAQDQRRAAVRQPRRYVATPAAGGDAIPNLFLAADYVQTFTDLATMEAANEAARRAVNGILEHSGSDAPPCRLWNLHEPELLEPWRANDRVRYRQGLPWDDTAVRLGLSALAALYRGASALEASIVNAVSSAMHVEDLLSYIRTGESRSELVERLTSGPGSAVW
jgi:hypothetical protein